MFKRVRSANEHSDHRSSMAVLWLIATSLFFVALLALIAVSVDQAYTVVVKSLLTSSGLAKIFWVGALIAGNPVWVFKCLQFHSSCHAWAWDLAVHIPTTPTLTRPVRAFLTLHGYSFGPSLCRIARLSQAPGGLSYEG